MIVAGGVFCDGGAANSLQIDSPELVSTRLNQWIKLQNQDNTTYLKAYISQADYAAAPSESAKRAEAQSTSTNTVWGVEYTYYWKFKIPADWVNFGSTSYAVVAQLHDINAPGIPRRPPVGIEIVDNVLKITLSNTANPFGVLLTSKSVSSGETVELFIRAKWADGTHVLASSGIFESSINDLPVVSINGQKNTWDDGAPTEPNPPYLKVGIYQPNTAEAWWVGKSMSMLHIAAIVGDSTETLATMRQYVDSAIGSNSARQVNPVYFG